MVTGGFAGAVGAVGFVLVGFREGRIFFRERAIDFVSRHMEEAEGSLLGIWQVIPVTTHGFEEVKGADDVGLNELARAMNRTIDMALGSKVDNGARFNIGQQVGDEVTVADAAANKLMTWVAFEFFEVLEVAGVGEQVEVNHWLITLVKPVENKIRSDEAGCSGNENGHYESLPNRSRV